MLFAEAMFYRIAMKFTMRFDTAFHIGSGMEGEAGSDHGILTDQQMQPFIPGSSLKGNLRSVIEKTVATLEDKNIWACGLENGLYHSYKQCIGGGLKDDVYIKANKVYQDSNGKNTNSIEENTCAVCQFFGSPLSSGRIFINDATLMNSEDFSLSRRDGVGICRDSGTAKAGIKYDYDTANSGLCYQISIEGEQVSQQDLTVLSLGILEWLHAGLRLGGKKTRGLGYASVGTDSLEIYTVDLKDPQQRKQYLLRGQMQKCENPQQFLQQQLETILV